MRNVTLVREFTGDDGTFGMIKTDSGLTLHSGELPWRNNAPNISCIPLGVYIVTWRLSAKRGMCYHVENVCARTDVEIHAANFMGDTAKGFRSELQGCIALGLDMGFMLQQHALWHSQTAIAQFIADLGKKDFQLTIDAGTNLLPI